MHTSTHTHTSTHITQTRTHTHAHIHKHTHADTAQCTSRPVLVTVPSTCVNQAWPLSDTYHSLARQVATFQGPYQWHSHDCLNASQTYKLTHRTCKHFRVSVLILLHWKMTNKIVHQLIYTVV